MKNINFIFFCLFLVHGISCNEGILSKFHQTRYKIKDIRIQLMSYNESMGNFEVKAFKCNRTTTAHNITFNLKVDVKDQVEVTVQANKFLSNEFRHFPVRFQTNMKKAIDSNAIGLASIKKCGNLSDFYLYKDVTYFSCNFVVDETRFPPLIPDGKYRINLTMTYLNQEVALLYMYGEVHTPIPYPKNGKFSSH